MPNVAFIRAGIPAAIAAVLTLSAAFPGGASAQSATPSRAPAVQDPGLRGGPAGAGGPLPGLNGLEKAFFRAARDIFAEVGSVTGTMPGEDGRGLGPRFNLNSCAGCHSQPAIGGTSPAVNPQVAIATQYGARNVVPPFISLNGPIREARFVKKPDGTPDGGVHALYVISGRSDAPGCNIRQPNFAAELARNNVVFRIPTPLFGLGLVENVSDRSLEAAIKSLAAMKSTLGVSGRFNRSDNDGTIMRFGWKAQNKSLMIFAGEAYNVEQGVTNELFPNERDDDPDCQFNPTPEDRTRLRVVENTGSPAVDYSADTVSFAAFSRLTAAPQPAPVTAQTSRGRRVFTSIGCQTCHAVKLTTAQSGFTGQSGVSFEPFSDFALHDMGQALADGVMQGQATGREFRTAPLWGLGQRIFFLHDGRTKDLQQAIRMHASAGSEANAVINAFNMLQADDKQALLAFLRSL
jgi:CxxC motif-containing protein (DUF1111 family)